MLRVEIPESELFDEDKQEFIVCQSGVLSLEHSLVSISKWEARWQKPFLGKDEKTFEETLDYVRCMTLTKDPPPDIYCTLPASVFTRIEEYINAPMTATWFNDPPNKPRSRDIVTAELIYYWMITLNIPMMCQTWHLNRLFTLIKVCNIKNQPPRKRGRKEMLSHRRALNEARRLELNTRG